MNIFIYQGKNGTRVELKSSDLDTMWATQGQIAEIFDSSISNISEHITNIYSNGELLMQDTFREFRNVSNQPVKHCQTKFRIRDLPLFLMIVILWLPVSGFTKKLLFIHFNLSSFF